MTVFANELYPDGCSCGINYLELGITYKQHLKESHMVGNKE